MSGGFAMVGTVHLLFILLCTLRRKKPKVGTGSYNTWFANYKLLLPDDNGINLVFCGFRTNSLALSQTFIDVI